MVEVLSECIHEIYELESMVSVIVINVKNGINDSGSTLDCLRFI